MVLLGAGEEEESSEWRMQIGLRLGCYDVDAFGIK